MDKKVGILLTVIVVAFAGLVGVSLFQNREQYDLNTIIPASEASGNIGENIEGDPEAPVLLFEYGDYQCTACAPMNPYINDLVEEYDGKLALVFRTYIVSYHQNGTAAASAAQAAAAQGYWKEYKDLLYTNQNEWYYSDPATCQQQFESYFMKVSDGKGDLERFREDVDSEAVAKKLNFDMGLGNRVKLQGTPMFIIGGEHISQEGVTKEAFMDKLRAKIDALLVEKGLEK